MTCWDTRSLRQGDVEGTDLLSLQGPHYPQPQTLGPSLRPETPAVQSQGPSQQCLIPHLPPTLHAQRGVGVMELEP